MAGLRSMIILVALSDLDGFEVNTLYLAVQIYLSKDIPSPGII